MWVCGDWLSYNNVAQTSISKLLNKVGMEVQKVHEQNSRSDNFPTSIVMSMTTWKDVAWDVYLQSVTHAVLLCWYPSLLYAAILVSLGLSRAEPLVIGQMSLSWGPRDLSLLYWRHPCHITELETHNPCNIQTRVSHCSPRSSIKEAKWDSVIVMLCMWRTL